MLPGMVGVARKIIVVGGALALSGCSMLDGPALTACEEWIIAGLKAPSTYKRIAREIVTIDHEKPPYLLVQVDYDAQNSYGALIRETKFCRFPFKNGQADTSGIINENGVSSTPPESDKTTEQLLNEVDAAVAEANAILAK